MDVGTGEGFEASAGDKDECGPVAAFCGADGDALFGGGREVLISARRRDESDGSTEGK